MNYLKLVCFIPIFDFDFVTLFNLLFLGAGLKAPKPQPKDLVDNLKIVKKSQADAVAICKSLTHGATPEAIELIKELAADLTDSTNQLVQGILFNMKQGEKSKIEFKKYLLTFLRSESSL